MKAVNMLVNISEAKNNLYKLIKMACRGKSIIITENDQPVADIIAHKSVSTRKLGLLKGEFKVPEDFNEESYQINKMFYRTDDEDNS